MFERRFCVPRVIFSKGFSAAAACSAFIPAGLRPDATGREGATSLKKVVAAMRYIAYGTPFDVIDNIFMFGEFTCVRSFK